MDKLESCFYIDFHSYDVTNLTEKQRKDCVRQGKQLQDAILAGKDTPTIKFFKYWKKDYVFDANLGRAIHKHNDVEEEEDGVMEDGMLIIKVKELEVYNKYDQETQIFDEHHIQLLLKQKEELSDKLGELRRGAGITDYAELKEKFTNLNRRHNQIQQIYKKKCEDYNKIKLKGQGKCAVDALIKEIDDYKRKIEWYFQQYGPIKSPVDN